MVIDASSSGADDASACALPEDAPTPDTEPPWRVTRYGKGLGQVYPVMGFGDGITAADADFIVHVCNHWQRLRARAERLEREVKEACSVLADGFVPGEERQSARRAGLRWLVKHAVEHHEWHHDAADSDYVRKVETERDEAWAEREEWAYAIRSVAFGAIPSPRAARAAIKELWVKCQALVEECDRLRANLAGVTGEHEHYAALLAAMTGERDAALADVAELADGSGTRRT